MEKTIGWDQITLDNAQIISRDDQEIILESARDGGGFTFSCEGFSAYNYLVCDMELLESHSQPFYLYFWKTEVNKAKPDNQNPFDFRVLSGIQPYLPVTWSFDFKLLDSQSLFPYRTPGRQKMVIAGKRSSIKEMKTVSFQIKESYHPVRMKLKHLRLTTETPAYQTPPVKLMDEMGQYMPKTWPGKQTSIQEMIQNIKSMADASEAYDNRFAQDNWSGWGGWKDKKLTEGSGYFATFHDGRRFWLTDPDGYAFFSIGPDCIGGDRNTRTDVMEHVLSWIPDDHEFPEAITTNDQMSQGQSYKLIDYPMINLIRTFGDQWKEKWQKMTANRLRGWGFNTVGNWTELDFCKQSRLPYVIPLDRFKKFPGTSRTIFRDFPDVFDPAYKQQAALFADGLKQFIDDPYLIGYFLCNEPNWAFEEGLNLGAELLAQDEPLVSKKNLIVFLQERYQQIEALNQAWQTAFTSFDDLLQPQKQPVKSESPQETDLLDFMEIMIREYVTVPSAACKAVDPNHLNLGMRWSWIHNPRQVAGWENYDVFSINCYSFDPRPAVDSVVKAGVNLPVIIGEFHHGALDGATSATGIRGVKTQAERGRAYRYYVEQGASHPNLVGCHYFDYNDQSAIGRFDGENYNIGFVDACQQPYQEMVDAALATAAVLYPVADGKQKAFDDLPEEIPSIFY